MLPYTFQNPTSNSQIYLHFSSEYRLTQAPDFPPGLALGGGVLCDPLLTSSDSIPPSRPPLPRAAGPTQLRLTAFISFGRPIPLPRYLLLIQASPGWGSCPLFSSLFHNWKFSIEYTVGANRGGSRPAPWGARES